MIRTRCALSFIVAVVLAAACAPEPGEQGAIPPATSDQEVLVFGSVDAVVEWLKAEQWWGEVPEGSAVSVPRAMITGIATRWRKAAQDIPVPEKKEIFYRLMLPLVLHANEMVLKRRARLEEMAADVTTGNDLSAEQLELLRAAAVLLRIRKEEDAASVDGDPAELKAVIDEALYKLDVIPPGLVLGQAAYESGYGTSRFAVEGNALFGQWTFGEGLVPAQQRKNLGDHRIASFDWPFDSVRGYYLNLSSHRAYEDFRQLRAKLKKEDKPLTSLELADGLRSYSERGQAYVDTLKGIIRKNGLDRADDAVFRDEALRFVVTADGEERAAELRDEIEVLRDSGELDQIIARMRLD